MTERGDLDPPRFVCPAGTVIGFRDGDVVRATGIRYARADRFAAPVPEPSASAPIRATAPAPVCPQAPSAVLDQLLNRPMGNLPQDEHCQRLSITRPAELAAGERLPVMVWIHGGSYVTGGGDIPIFDPRPLVSEQRVIMVAVTYRLGLFGFLGSAGGRPANLGLLDLIEALRWVRRNIAAFGGDPTAVTLFGQSAGADAIAHLMITEEVSGLFRRVIIQSAPLGISRGRQRMSEAMAAVAATVADIPSADLLVAVQPRVEAAAAPFGLRAAMPFGTQYGQPPLPAESELDEAWRRRAREVDVLIGHTDHEVAFFVPGSPVVSRLARIPLLGPPIRAAVVAVVTRAVYSRSARAFARRHARAGGRGYRYVISWGAPGSPYAGAHAIELPLLFPDPDQWRDALLIRGADWAEVERQGRLLRRIWADFARTGEVAPGEHAGLIKIYPPDA